MAKNYVINHDMYFMNHKNGDVLKVTVKNDDHSVKNLKLYRQDGFGHYYYDQTSQAKNIDHLETKEDVIAASKEIGAHNTHHLGKWHHEVKPVYNNRQNIIDFRPKLALKKHKQIQNAKRFLRHYNQKHAYFLFELSSQGPIASSLSQLRDWIYEDRNKELVLDHKIRKLAK